MSITFQQLRRAKGLTSQDVADAAGISLTDEYLFEIHCLTDEAIKHRIIQAFSILTGHRYTLQDFASVEEQPTTVMQHVGRSRRVHRRKS